MGGPDAERVVGWALFGQQTRALLIKNALLAWRNKASTFLQVFASFFFIFLIFAVNESVKASLSGISTFQNVYTPTPKPIPAIPPCSSGYFMQSNCYDFVWSGSNSPVITELVQNITKNNPGRPIDFASQTKGFPTPADVDAWLLANPFQTPGALLFNVTPTGTIGYGLQTNSTSKQQRGKYEDPTFTFQLPLQAAAEWAIAQYAAKNWDISWTPSTAEFAHPATDLLNVVASAGAVFLFAAAMFNFVIQMSNLVMEKETRLRQAMSTMGLMDSVYWLTWTLWELGLAIVSCLLLVAFGYMFQFDFFKHNGFGVLFFLFFLFWACMTSVAYLVSAFLKKSSSANTIGFFLFIIGFILQLVVVFGFPYENEFAGYWRVIFSLFPPNLLAIGLKYLGDATATPEDPGITLSTVGQCAPRNPNCVLTIAGVYAWLFVLFWVYLIIAIYLDNVLPDVNGVRKPLFYFLNPSFWTGRSSRRKRRGFEVDQDVLAEEQRVKAIASQAPAEEGHAALDDVALSVRGLQKVFPARRSCCGCCGKLKPAFHAVKGPWFEVQKETLLCLLGPNGAGKSTTINCLTGIIPTTAGDGLIYGLSIRDPASMSEIRRTMGVCPQFDVLWDRLSGKEHLYLFARIKGLKSAHIPKEVETLLEEVRLTEAGSTRTGSYSGGMRRRLSVAVALIGNPSIVFLDEPTTGMDPVSRRYVWDIIERAKRGRAIILTTHSMEEADILGDRIAIMAKGRLRCLGTSIHLKQRFGSGIVVTVGVDKPAAEKGALPKVGSYPALADSANDASKTAVKNFFYQRMGVAPSDESRNYLKFAIPRVIEDNEVAQTGAMRQKEEQEDSRLTAFFKELRDRREELGITDLQLSLTTLEEVFLNIARLAELETAAAEGRYDSLVLPSGVTVKVPIGAEKVSISTLGEAGEGSGPWVMDVEWQQDDEGNLRISRHSDPVPAEAATLDGAEPTPAKKSKGKGGCLCCGKKQITIVAEALDEQPAE